VSGYRIIPKTKGSVPFLTLGIICPESRTSNQWRYHGQYNKYHRSEILTNLRVSCCCSKKTHAIMPSFSLPHSSLDVDDLDSYLLARAKEASRREAVTAVPGMANYTYRTLIRLEQRNLERNAQLRSLLTESVPASRKCQELSYLVQSGFSLSSMNRYCLTHYGRGWFCGNLRWLGRKTNTGMGFSHNLQNTLTLSDPIDSS
jgi:hypothetical protein